MIIANNCKVYYSCNCIFKIRSSCKTMIVPSELVLFISSFSPILYYKLLTTNSQLRKQLINNRTTIEANWKRTKYIANREEHVIRSYDMDSIDGLYLNLQYDIYRALRLLDYDTDIHLEYGKYAGISVENTPQSDVFDRAYRIEKSNKTTKSTLYYYTLETGQIDGELKRSIECKDKVKRNQEIFNYKCGIKHGKFAVNSYFDDNGEYSPLIKNKVIGSYYFGLFDGEIKSYVYNREGDRVLRYKYIYDKGVILERIRYYSNSYYVIKYDKGKIIKLLMYVGSNLIKEFDIIVGW